MGFFSSTPAASAQPEPLSQERVKEQLEALELKYSIDDDGDIAVLFDDGYFYIVYAGEDNEILTVRGTWFGTLPAESFNEVALMANSWNENTIFTKAYAVAVELPDNGGTVTRVGTQHNVDYENGVTDEQLKLHLVSAIRTALQLFEKCNEQYPDAVKPESGE